MLALLMQNIQYIVHAKAACTPDAGQQERCKQLQHHLLNSSAPILNMKIHIRATALKQLLQVLDKWRHGNKKKVPISRGAYIQSSRAWFKPSFVSYQTEKASPMKVRPQDETLSNRRENTWLESGPQRLDRICVLLPLSKFKPILQQLNIVTCAPLRQSSDVKKC